MDRGKMQDTQLGIAGVLSHYDKSADNARKLSLEQETELRDKLRQYRPIDVLSEAICHGTGDFWTVEDVKQVVNQWYGVTYDHVSSYRRLLHRCGFSYQKVEQVYKSRPSVVDVVVSPTVASASATAVVCGNCVASIRPKPITPTIMRANTPISHFCVMSFSPSESSISSSTNFALISYLRCVDNMCRACGFMW